MNQQIEKIGRFGIECISEIALSAIIMTSSVYGFLSLNTIPVVV